MSVTTTARVRGLPLLVLLLGSLSSPLLEAAPPDPRRGLWVGQVTLERVNEVSVPLDENNVPVAPDPGQPTATADQAQLRLIVHVDGTGQARLLKSVAILDRLPGATPWRGERLVNLLDDGTALAADPMPASDSDLALVSDPRLYDDYPTQPARRIASAVFDWADPHPGAALDALVDAVVPAAAASVAGSGEDLDTLSGRQAAIDDASAAALGAAQPVVDNADVASAFGEFLRTQLAPDTVDTIAAAADPAAAASGARSAAEALLGRSVYYPDPRGVALVDGIVAAVENAANPAAAALAAHNIASNYADVADDYHRFLAGRQLGEMIRAAADSAAGAAVQSGADRSSIRAAVDTDPVVNDTRAESLRLAGLKLVNYQDTRYDDALGLILDAIVASAATALPAAPAAQALIADAAAGAGRQSLNNQVARFPRPTTIPSPDYNEFIADSAFLASARSAADAAAAGALAERRNNFLWTDASLAGAARVAASAALADLYQRAARVPQDALAFSGDFGAEDTATLSVTLVLPADHPTNPFRHRRHPDHSRGFRISREIQLSFDATPEEPLARAGFGVRRVGGRYREEIHGLHKPLGPAADTGLIVEGRFLLNRISLIDTLNAR